MIVIKFFILFLLATTPLAPGSYAAEGLVHTFNQGNAYSQYYTWAALRQGRIELAFKTSKENATLIYIASNVTLVHVTLQNGRIGCSAKLASSSTGEDISPLLQGTVTGLFNDDQWHHLILLHDIRQIIVRIDKNSKIILFADNSKYYVLKTGTPLYIGGIPLSAKLSSPSFKGCIKNVLIRNNTLHSNSYAKPVLQNMTSPGCIEPCQNQTCSEEETCINDWSKGVGLCSCISLDMACLKSITKGPVSLDGTNYRCYDTYSYFEPHISSYLFLRLKPPYPPDGILLTFYSLHSHHRRYAFLYVNNSLLHFAVYQGTSIISLLKFSNTTIRGSHYQISILRNKITVDITLTPLSIGDHERTQRRLTNEFSENSRERICLGQGTSKQYGYTGSVEVLQQGLQVYRYLEDLSLNVSPLRYLPGNGSSYLSLWPNALSKYKTLSFRFWMIRPGSLIYMSRDGHTLNIQLDEEWIIIENGSVTRRCNGRSIRKDAWLFFSLSRPHVSKLLVTVDHFECIIDDETIQTVTNGPIYIGKPVSRASNTFRGYIEGISAENMPPICAVIHP